MNKIIIFEKKYEDKLYFNLVLKSIFGLNWFHIQYILGIHGLSNNLKLKNLPHNLFNFLNKLLIQNYKIDKILFKEYKKKIQFKKQIGIYKGLRLKLGLPARGQRTHSNAKTAKKFLF